MLQGDFLKNDVITGFQEAGEEAGMPKEGADVGEALVETSDHVEDESPVSDGLAKGAKIVGHLLQAAAVLGDGEVALNKVANFVSNWMERASRLPRN